MDYEVIVVDNDDLKSGEATVREFQDKPARWRRLLYSVEGVQNIALARNHAVDLAEGRYLAFLDDDESACADWLSQLWKMAQDTDATAVFGLIQPVFPPGVSQLIRNARVFQAPRLTAGATEGFVRSTGNTLVVKRIFSEVRFDPAFGISGGSDSVFFDVLSRRAARFVWCPNAVVREYLPGHRTKFRWLLGRSYRSGHLTCRMLKLTSNAAEVRKASVVRGQKALVALVNPLTYFQPDKQLQLARDVGFVAAFFSLPCRYYLNRKTE